MKKMFVLVRGDLGNPYKMVQGAHAVAQYALEEPQMFNEWNNETIVFLDVKNEDAMMKWAYGILKYTDKKYSLFFEPDLADESRGIYSQLTAIACYDDGQMFKGLQVAK